MLRRTCLLTPLGLLAAPGPARAQAPWAPTRPVVLVVPFAPGGPNDLVARLIAPHLQAALGQNVVVENRPGATGAIAARHVAALPPDGHALIVAASGTMTINPAVMRQPGYDPERDFAPVTLAMSVPNMLVVHKDVPARTVAEVIDWLKREGGRASYSSGGVGSTEQLGMELFLRATGTQATHVPFQGGAPATTAMIQGTVQASILNAATVRPHVESGALRAIAIAMPRRFAPLPDHRHRHAAPLRAPARRAHHGRGRLPAGGLGLLVGLPRAGEYACPRHRPAARDDHRGPAPARGDRAPEASPSTPAPRPSSARPSRPSLRAGSRWCARRASR